MFEDEALLTLIAQTDIEQALLDWLLDYADDLVFASSVVDYHGVAHAALSLREQVTGRQKMLMVQIRSSQAGVAGLCSRLGDDFGGAAIRYWVIPVSDSGVLGEQSAAPRSPARPDTISPVATDQEGPD